MVPLMVLELSAKAAAGIITAILTVVMIDKSNFFMLYSLASFICTLL
jgi:hypothetical protein